MFFRNKSTFSFDVEDWHQSIFRQFNSQSLDIQHVEHAVKKYIQLCSYYHVRSTCFIVGSLAKNQPKIVEDLLFAGHEIASHSLTHKPLYTLSETEMAAEIKESKSILEQITGKPINGFRAPCWSVSPINAETYYHLLEDLGYSYSSSIYPGETYLYGFPGFPQKPHKPIINGRKTSIVEFPGPMLNLGKFACGYSGGFYFRVLPYPIISRLFDKEIKRNGSAFSYIHPYEIEPLVKIDANSLKFMEKMVLYYRTKSNLNRVSKFLNRFGKDMLPFCDRLEQFDMNINET
jgi:polysaccharide deacetylase family protein (PEP-CTERM system associated)